MADTCAECRYNHGGYCELKEKTVNSGAGACCDFEER